MVKGNVDKVLDYLRTKKTATVGELSKQLHIPKENLMQSTQYMEQDGVVKVDHKFPNTYVTLIKDPEQNNTSQQPPSPPQQPPSPQMNQTNQFKQAGPQSFNQQSPTPPGQFNQQNPPQLTQQNPPGTQGQFNQAGPQSFNQQQPAPTGQFNQQNPPGMQQPFNQQNQPSSGAPQNGPQQPMYGPNTMQQPPVQDSQIRPQNQDPLNERPDFSMEAPSPMGNTSPHNEIRGYEDIKSSLHYSDDYRPHKEYVFPDYAESDLDKMEFLMDVVNNKITNHEYDNLNVLYRKIFNIYESTEDLSSNERHIISRKIGDLFNRIKRTYMIENVVN